MFPKARKNKISIRELAEETIVYDLERDKAHSLNPTSAFIWRHCDGKTSVVELARLVHAELELPDSPELVQLALDQMARRHLLTEAMPAPASRREFAGCSRRDMLKKLAVAAVALPIIMTITARRARAGIIPSTPPSSVFVGPHFSKQCPPGSASCGSNGLSLVCCPPGVICRDASNANINLRCGALT